MIIKIVIGITIAIVIGYIIKIVIIDKSKRDYNRTTN
jgi:uncharacterized membrane protein YraQ (UPF0718 family)